jgi:cytochrome c oxidase subunit II
MAGGALVVWAATMAVAVYAFAANPEKQGPATARWMIVYAGAIVPTVVLTVLLVFGLRILPPMVRRAPEGSLTIAVTGEQWWWRVAYRMEDGTEVPLANEIRLPVGEPVEFILRSPDVIHSFWIPSLGGKRDMIPGRVTRLTLLPSRTGTYRGVCAEYCGESHALMAFEVVVMEPDDFRNWLGKERQPARESTDPLGNRGKELFMENGCSACHTIRGTQAAGVVGPDLTHVGSRLSLGAGILPNEPDAFRRWLVHTDQLKPGVTMPHFRMLPQDEVEAVSVYLESLE